MTAATRPVKPARTAASGWWTFLRLLGGWATVAALAYLLWMPGQDFGWLKMVLVWVLLTLVADEFAGWFGYIGLALGLLPFFYAGTPEQWFVVFPLLAGAMGAYLIMKHSGGPFVLPFAALLFAGALLGAARFGVKLDPSLKIPANRAFQQAALYPMLGVTAFSFLRQLSAMLWRWNVHRRRVRLAKAEAAAHAVLPTSAPTTAPEPALPVEKSMQTPVLTASPEVAVKLPATPTAAPAVIDIDLDEPLTDEQKA